MHVCIRQCKVWNHESMKSMVNAWWMHVCIRKCKVWNHFLIHWKMAPMLSILGYFPFNGTQWIRESLEKKDITCWRGQNDALKQKQAIGRDVIMHMCLKCSLFIMSMKFHLYKLVEYWIYVEENKNMYLVRLLLVTKFHESCMYRWGLKICSKWACDTDSNSWACWHEEGADWSKAMIKELKGR